VIVYDARGWRAWICCHPLDDPDATGPHVDRVRHQPRRHRLDVARSRTRATPGTLDQRGTRVTAIIERANDVIAF